MRARIARPVKTLTSVLIATLVGDLAASTTGDGSPARSTSAAPRPVTPATLGT